MRVSEQQPSAENDAPWAGTKMPVHLLIETGRASRLAACDEPFANGQWGSEDIADVTCRACLALFPTRVIPPARGES